MTSEMLSLVLFVFMFTSTRAQISLMGRCADPSPVENFDIERFLGKWFEYKRYPLAYQGTATCAFQRLQSTGNGTYVMEYHYINYNFDFIVAATVTFDNESEAIFNVSSPVINDEPLTISILDTDYDNYAIAYQCINSTDGFYHTLSWVLSRNETLSEEVSATVDEFIKTTPGLLKQFYNQIDFSEESCRFTYPAVIGNVTVAPLSDIRS